MLYYLNFDCSVVQLSILIFAKHFCQHSSLEGWNIFQVCDPADCQGHVIGDDCQDKDHHPAHLSMWIHHSLKGKKLSEKSLCHFYQSANEICILKPTNLQNWWSSGTCCQHGWLPAWRRPPPTRAPAVRPLGRKPWEVVQCFRWGYYLKTFYVVYEEMESQL